MTEYRYSAADLTVITLADVVRKRPDMFFGPPRAFSAPAGSGTRVAYVLDADYFGADVITADLAGLDLPTAGSGEILVRDHRNRDRPAEYRYA